VLCKSCITTHGLRNLPAEAPSVADLSRLTTPCKRMLERCLMVATNRKKAGQTPWSDRESAPTKLPSVQLRSERESAVLLKLVTSHHRLCTLPLAALAALACGPAYLIRALRMGSAFYYPFAKSALYIHLPPCYNINFHLLSGMPGGKLACILLGALIWHAFDHLDGDHGYDRWS